MRGEEKQMGRRLKVEKMSKVIGKKLVAEGKFLKLEQVEFVDDHGRERNWEAAGRVGSRGAVVIIGHLMPSNRLVLVRQFRPPAGKYVVEFPAGLIDPGEAPEETAKRELREETGFAGLLSFCSPPVYGSSGLTGEATNIAIVEINDYDYPHGMPPTFQEDSENIEVFAVEIPRLHDFVEERLRSGDGVDSKILVFMMAHRFFHA